MNQANYSKYLASVFPGTAWTVERLSGGLVNTTLRATRTSGECEHVSLIVKHARPYIEVAGPEWGFSLKRQEVEALFLRMWDETGTLFDTRKQTGLWRSPRCLHHQEGTESALGLSDKDQETSVLILSDLGNLVNIFTFLQARARDPWEEVGDHINQLGYELGRIFAIIHSRDTLEKVKAVPGAMETLTKPLSKDIVRIATVEPAGDRLKTLPNGAQLYKRLEEDYHSPKSNYRWALMLGDFTQGSILMRPPDEEEDWTPTIIDWEFGQLNGRGVNGDMAQFLAHLHCEILAKAGDAPLHRVLTVFTEQFCAGYQETAELALQQNASDEKLQLLRGTFITHGREMVNQAAEQYAGHAKYDDIFCVGLWYLEQAGDDADEFATDENWAKLREEDSRILLSLFRGP
ncbi:kinase-like domain-containing protein [Dactylonectria estremocensis]|uniref:Kinase-like domain-containing protein n=1 Tax=Dactylonectria estremocensis TaxID=1079267 RepID=A0A9P9EWX3_9HYPO|nr:kinase-like domain-containing protein [Dactylonectria estremocensis]